MFKLIGLLGRASILIYIYCLVTWGVCVYKATQCNWEPIGKSEIVYTAGALTPACVVIAWLNVQDK